MDYTKKFIPGGWKPSMGGIGAAHADDVTRVHWKDGTELVVTDRSAYAVYRGKRFDLACIPGDHDQVVDYWTAAITKRLKRDEVGPLTARVRAGWSSPLPSAA